MGELLTFGGRNVVFTVYSVDGVGRGVVPSANRLKGVRQGAHVLRSEPMRKRSLQSRWENVPAVARAHAGAALDTGIPAVGGTCHKQGTPLFRARTALESSP